MKKDVDVSLSEAEVNVNEVKSGRWSDNHEDTQLKERIGIRERCKTDVNSDFEEDKGFLNTNAFSEIADA